MNMPSGPVRVMRARVEEDRSSDRVCRRVIFGVAGEPEQTIFWHITGPETALPSPLTRADLAATALIYLAMRQGCALHIEGDVSERLLTNLEDLQIAWNMWMPDRYSIVPLSADREINKPRNRSDRRHTGVVAFSGGVDSTASVWRHHSGLAGRATRRLKTAIFAKGFDIPLDRVEGWQVAVGAATRTLSDINLPLCIVETNWRTATDTDWEMEHGAAVVSCLRQWEEDADTLIMAADHNYARFLTPWGSNPITNTMFESEDTSIPFDGGGCSRSEKVALIHQWPAGYNALRVCYEDDVSGRNCGQCSKCVMTKMNALAFGLEVPTSLYAPPTVAELKKMERVRGMLAHTLIIADERGIKSPLFEALRTRKRQLDILDAARSAKRKVETFLSGG